MWVEKQSKWYAQTWGNLVVKLIKEENKSFLSNEIIGNASINSKQFWELFKTFFTEIAFHYN